MKHSLIKSWAFAALASFSAMSLAAQELIVGTCATFAPFEYLDSTTNEYAGFDIDISKEIAKRGGYTLTIVNMGFDGIIPALLSRSIHMAASGITITEKRLKKVAFTTPYYEAGQGLLVRTHDAKKYATLKDLEGVKIGVQIATTGAEIAQAIKGAEIKTFNAGTEAILDLKNNGCDAVIFDRPVIAYFMVKNPGLAKGLTHKKVASSAEFFGLAFNKKDKALLKKVNDILKKMHEDGTYDTIYAKWFGK